MVRRARAAGRRVPLEYTTPWKVVKDVGMGIVIAMLEKSINPRRNNDAYMQFDTHRKLRSVAVNIYADTSQASYLI